MNSFGLDVNIKSTRNGDTALGFACILTSRSTQSQFIVHLFFLLGLLDFCSLKTKYRERIQPLRKNIPHLPWGIFFFRASSNRISKSSEYDTDAPINMFSSLMARASV